MLYERWREIAASRPRETALRDLITGRHWTFEELFAAGETRRLDAGPCVFPQGLQPEFILDVLAAWRSQSSVCPLETGQAPPRIEMVPKFHRHFKITSATSGSRKMVAFTESQLAADADAIVATMGLRPDWPNLGVISLAHSYGFSNLVLPLLLHGIPLVQAGGPLPEQVRTAAGRVQALTLPAVPALWRAWHEAGAIPPHTRLAISAGAPLPLSLEHDVFQFAGLKIHNFLGASECGGIAYDASHEPRNDPTLVGSPLRQVQVSISHQGCLVVQSSAVGESYWPDPAPELDHGVFHTSDLAELRDGRLYLLGRSGDLINVAGRKVAPETIERVLLSHPHVRECLTFGVPSKVPERSDSIVALVAGSAEENELKCFLRSHLPDWQMPRYWHFVDSLQTNSRGKISRSQCREWWQSLGRT